MGLANQGTSFVCESRGSGQDDSVIGRRTDPPSQTLFEVRVAASHRVVLSFLSCCSEYRTPAATYRLARNSSVQEIGSRRCIFAKPGRPLFVPGPSLLTVVASRQQPFVKLPACLLHLPGRPSGSIPVSRTWSITVAPLTCPFLFFCLLSK